MTKPYVGIRPDGTREVFHASDTPTFETHGAVYSATIGPFETLSGADYMAKYGAGNPHLQHVDDAERFAKIEREKKNRARRERNQAMRDLGLVRVRGNLGGVYWE